MNNNNKYQTDSSRNSMQNNNRQNRSRSVKNLPSGQENVQIEQRQAVEDTQQHFYTSTY